jgi:hypothetical protein
MLDASVRRGELAFHLLLKCIHALEKLLDLHVSLLNFLLQFPGRRLLRGGCIAIDQSSSEDADEAHSRQKRD